MTDKINSYDRLQIQTNPLLFSIGKWGAIAIITYYLLTEHREHVFQYLPYMLVLACPIMHFFMHGHHGGHQHHKEERKDQP